LAKVLTITANAPGEEHVKSVALHSARIHQKTNYPWPVDNRKIIRSNPVKYLSKREWERVKYLN
jgi:hypothetical protein